MELTALHCIVTINSWHQPTSLSFSLFLCLLLFISSSLLLTPFHRLFFLFFSSFFLTLHTGASSLFSAIITPTTTSFLLSSIFLLFLTLRPHNLSSSFFSSFSSGFFFFPLICTGRELLFRPKQTGIWGIVLISLHGRASGSPRPPPILLVQWGSHIVAWGAWPLQNFFFSH